MRLAKLAITMAAAGLLAVPAPAQQGAPFEINPQRVRYAAPNACGKSTTYIVPTAYLMIEARNKLTSWNRRLSYRARAFVEGYSKELLQDLARQVQDDLIARMRAAGYTVLTYDDIATDVAGARRMTPNPRYGMPTKDTRAMPDADFLIATPTDAQALDYNLLGSPVGPYTDAIKRTHATLLLPEIYFTLPQIQPTKDSHTYEISAGAQLSPAMHLYAANMYGVPANLGWCNILVAEHGQRPAAEAAGTLSQFGGSEDSYGDWGTKRGDFLLTLDRGAFTAGVLRVGNAFNALIVETVNKGHAAG